MKSRVTDRAIYISSGLFIVASVVASAVLRVFTLGLPVRILIGLVPVSLLVFQVILLFRYTIEQDEVQKRIILEGLAIAFAIALPIIFTIGSIMKAGVSLPLGFMDGVYFLEAALLIGYAIAYRRYQ